MKCLKCGREQDSEQVFCDDCLLEMEKYPVSPNANVQLPMRRDTHTARKTASRRRSVNPEEQIRQLKKRLWFLTGALVITLALMLAMIYPTVNYFLRSYHLRPGQNYSTIIPSTTVPEATEPIETLDPWEGYAE